MMDKLNILQGGYFNSTLRTWQSSGTEIGAHNLMYPVFIMENDDGLEPIGSMPGINRMGINQLKIHLEPLIKLGLKSVLLFGVLDKLPKDEVGSSADSDGNPIVRCLPLLRTWFPDLTIACDVCLCGYTSHGHCGVLDSDGTINNPKSIKRIAEVALKYAKSGAHMLAPSDMMDGRIIAIKDSLVEHGISNKVAVLSYSAKFASTFYGPFRDAAHSKPSFGDRKSYQLPSCSKGLAHRATARDVQNGADMLMVKPGLAYLDLVQSLKTEFPHHPMFVYQVSGEYAMLYHAAKNGAFDLKDALMEILCGMRRAGGDVIITYFTPLILDWLSLKSKY
nr:delta-aminolevulinic acid dehydratase [Onthophagus taurus]